MGKYVTYNQAVKLKEMGCYLPSVAEYYTLNGTDWLFTDDWYFDIEDVIGKNFKISAPLKSDVLTWFEDKFKIFTDVVTDCTTEPKFCYQIHKFIGNPDDLSSEPWEWKSGQYSPLYRTRDEAITEAINQLLFI